VRNAIVLAVVACNAAAPQPAPSHAVNDVERPQSARDASAAEWIEVNCSTLLTSEDIAATCNSAQKLPGLLPDRSEGTVGPPVDLNPSTRATCARSLKLDGDGVFLHFAVIDYSTAEALTKITEIWERSFPHDFRDGLRVHEVKHNAIRREVEGSMGRLSVSVFETDQIGHSALCRSENLIKIVRLMGSRLRRDGNRPPGDVP
jgi:hypothetical protein